MLGNLWEWTQDCYSDSYRSQSQPTRAAPSASSKAAARSSRCPGAFSDRHDAEHEKGFTGMPKALPKAELTSVGAAVNGRHGLARPLGPLTACVVA